MVDWWALFGFTVISITGIISCLYFPAAFVEKKWPFHEKKGNKVNSGGKFG